MPLAKNLSDFIGKYGEELAEAADEILKPLVNPEADALPDLSDLENHRSKQSGVKFKFFPAQVEKIAGTAAGLKERKRAWLIAEMACGKSVMSLAAAHLIFKHKHWHGIVLCPGHLVKKWKRETDWAIPNVYSKIVKTMKHLMEFRAVAMQHQGPAIMIISKESAKLGYDYTARCAAFRLRPAQRFVHSQCEIQKGEWGFRPRNDDEWNRTYYYQREKLPNYVVNTKEKVIACPRCGTVDDDKRVLYSAYMSGKGEIEKCPKCGEKFVTHARGWRKNPHLDRYIQKKMKGFFDILIADEVHELAGAETAQGNAFGSLAASCKYGLGLTGTLIGGKATDLHAPLWRMSPDLLKQRGFDLSSLKGGKAGAIGRNEKVFVDKYGVMEHQVIRALNTDQRYVHFGSSSRRKQYKSQERVRPGISPDLFNHFLCGRAVFMSLNELGPALPTIERVLIPCKAGEELAAAYHHIDAEIKDFMDANRGAAGTLAAARVQVLDAYLDKPWGWEPVKAHYYDNHERVTVDVVTPEDLGENYCDDKDRKLVELCKDEVANGRKCCVYTVFTSKHNVRNKIQQELEKVGLRAVVLPDSVVPIKREEWIEKHISKIDVLIVHPKRVMTGLDLVQFPSLIWYQVGYSTHVLRQASARARRPQQKHPCKVFFLYYEGTIQETALHLMGEKESASQSLEGKFDTRGLKAMMNGGETDDILATLSRGLKITGRSVKDAWKEVDKADNPFLHRSPRRKAAPSPIPEKKYTTFALFSTSKTEPEYEAPSLFSVA